MFYLDNDLKNDTVQFDLAVERFKINSDYIDKNIEQIISTLSDSLYDIENFSMDNETRTSLGRRFPEFLTLTMIHPIHSRACATPSIRGLRASC